MEESSLHATAFMENRDRLLEHEVAENFFMSFVGLARMESLLPDGHFTVDGRLIEDWASSKSFS